MHYCQNIENIIGKSLKNSLSKDMIDAKEIKSIIEQISKISIGSNMESSNNMVVKLSPESLACQVKKYLLC